MTIVWRLRSNVTDFNYLAPRPASIGTVPRRDGTSLIATWEPKEVWYHPLDFKKNKGIANFPMWSSVIVCDAAAKDIIYELTKDCVEFLPLSSPTIPETEYFALNCVKVLDCLDMERSEFTRFEKTGGIRSIRRYEFKANCIDGIPVFKLPILNSARTFVTNEFKQLVEDNNLTGLEFQKVWEG
ncbi:MAG: hypothetical protein OXG39_18275 [Chloroflexi bacterium]|nr:hypothetical protein [Chloroflexota bacterium]